MISISRPIGRLAGEHDAAAFEPLHENRIHFEAMPVPLGDLRLAICFRGIVFATSFAGYAPSRIVAPYFFSAISFFCSGMMSMIGYLVFGSISVVFASFMLQAHRAQIPRWRAACHSKARNTGFCSRGNSGWRPISLHAAAAETAGNDDAIDTAQAPRARCGFLFELLRIEPLDLRLHAPNAAACLIDSITERYESASMKFPARKIFSDDADAHRLLRVDARVGQTRATPSYPFSRGRMQSFSKMMSPRLSFSKLTGTS